MNKKIAIVMDNCSSGGVAQALNTFLKFVADSSLEITLFVRDFKSLSKFEVPDNVDCSAWSTSQNLSSVLKTKGVIKGIRVLLNYLMIIMSWRNCGKKTVYKTRCLNEVPGHYDCVIAYHMIPNDVTIMALEKIDADRKILWLHGRKNFKERDLPFYDAIYSKADLIVCVSKDTEKRFKKLMPKCADKTVTIYNFFDIDQIKKLSKEPVEDFDKTENSVTIVSVGRLSKEKGFDRVPVVARKLLDDGYDVQWYIIGEGDKRKEIEQEIEDRNVLWNVHLMGYRENPYPFIRRCDIYVQPSYTEGFCTSTMEAKILSKPVVATRVPGMGEQFISEKNGLIVESSIEGISNGIKRLIETPSLKEAIINNLNTELISNDTTLSDTWRAIVGTEYEA